MQLRRPDQSEWRRGAVFVAVAVLHVLAGLLIFATGGIRIERLGDERPLSLLSLSRAIPSKVSVIPPTINQSLGRRESLPDIDLPLNLVPPEPSNAITPLDLSSNADAVARRESGKAESEKRWRNLAGPSESQLEWWKDNAPLSRDPQAGDSEHAEGGENITWVNEKCYYTSHGITTFGMPQMSMVCKDPPKPDTELFKDMRKKLDESTKGRAP